jgi:hypothetical protein
LRLQLGFTDEYSISNSQGLRRLGWFVVDRRVFEQFLGTTARAVEARRQKNIEALPGFKFFDRETRASCKKVKYQR